MNYPKLNWTPEEAEKYKKFAGSYPAGYKPPTPPKYSDKEEAAMRIQEQSFRGLPVTPGSVYPGSSIATIDSLATGLKLKQNEAERLRIAQEKEKRDITKFNVDYKKSLLGLQAKQKKAETEKVDDIEKERAGLFTKLSQAQDILNKTKKVTLTDEEGEYVEDVEKPTYSPQQRNQAKRAVEGYTKRLQIISMTEKFREKGLDVNISDVEKYIKEQEKNIDAITLEMTKKGIPDRVGMVFKNTALQIMMEGNSKQTAMQKAAEQVKTLFPQYFQ